MVVRWTVKFCCIDNQVVIAGNGNQDAQSWNHSQEVNIMVDSAKLATEWVKALKQRYAGMQLIVGRDKLDEIQVSVSVLSHIYPADTRTTGRAPQDSRLRAVPHTPP